MIAKMTTTYSMWSMFRNCRKACQWRYLDQLVALDRAHSLAFGSVIHVCLELWHRHRDLERVLAHIHGAYPDRGGDQTRRADWHLATAMMKGYAAQYPEEDFEVVALEKTFEGPIVNPATGAASRSFTLAGKVDGIVGKDGQYFLLEHKTASLIDAGYLERLWGDFQIQLYCWYIEQTFGLRIGGVIYNILAKAKLRQRQGETEDEYQARREELIAKSKSGKTTAKRRMPETDEEFQTRLAEWYAQPDAFHREMLFVGRDQFDTLRAELWELTRSFLDARRRGVYYQNTSQCFQYGRPCPYFALCRSGGSPNVIENFYRREAPHTELRDGDDAGSDQPIF
jgi:hypothetical protein